MNVKLKHQQDGTVEQSTYTETKACSTYLTLNFESTPANTDVSRNESVKNKINTIVQEL